MKKSRFTEPQILTILKQGESGVPVPDICREHGISNATYYNWRSKYGSMDALLMSEMKAMADENRRLKKMHAELAMQNELLKDALGKTASKALSPLRQSPRHQACLTCWS
jgi:putative transposase